MTELDPSPHQLHALQGGRLRGDQRPRLSARCASSWRRCGACSARHQAGAPALQVRPEIVQHALQSEGQGPEQRDQK